MVGAFCILDIECWLLDVWLIYVIFCLSLIYPLALQVLPMLAAALEFGSAGASALNPLLKMGSWLPADDFNIKVSYLLLWIQ